MAKDRAEGADDREHNRRVAIGNGFATLDSRISKFCSESHFVFTELRVRRKGIGWQVIVKGYDFERPEDGSGAKIAFRDMESLSQLYDRLNDIISKNVWREDLPFNHPRAVEMRARRSRADL